MAGHILEIPKPPKIFYITTEWSKDGMGVVLLQADDCVEERQLEAQ